MSEELFRKKCLNKIQSPDNLEEYIRVSDPCVWLFLAGVILLLAGACIWGIFGRVDSTVNTSVYAEDGISACYIDEEDIFSVKAGMTVKFDGYEANISEISGKDQQYYVCLLESEQNIPDGLYSGKVVVATNKPISFILN